MLEMKRQSGVMQISVAQLKVWQAEQKDLVLLDVRQPQEHVLGHIGGILIPLDRFEEAMVALNPKCRYVVYCRSGGRSQTAAQWMVQSGFSEVYNLEGGYLAWESSVDAS